MLPDPDDVAYQRLFIDMMLTLVTDVEATKPRDFARAYRDALLDLRLAAE